MNQITGKRLLLLLVVISSVISCSGESFKTEVANVGNQNTADSTSDNNSDSVPEPSEPGNGGADTGNNSAPTSEPGEAGSGDANTNTGNNSAPTPEPSNGDADTFNGDSSPETGEASDGDAVATTDPENIDCPTPPAVECLVRLYPQCGYQGPEVCLTEERYYNHTELESMGLKKGAARSVRVADGYYGKFNFTGDPNDDWGMVMRGNDSCLYLGKEPGGFAFKNLDVTRRNVCRNRPRIFMAMHGSNRLATSELDNEWTYVREHLDGIWENNVGMSSDEMAAIYRKIATRTIILEQGGSKGKALIPVEAFSTMQKLNPDIELIREAMALYKHPATEWNVDDIAKAKSEYVFNSDAPSWMKFKNVYGGFQPQQFLLPQDKPKTPTLDQTEAKTVIEQIDGGFAECGSDRCRGHLKRALYNFIGQVRKGSRPFIWFNGTFDDPQEWFKGLKQEYYLLESDDMLRPDDVVMVINYKGGFASTPEVTQAQPDGAATATGILYWLLHQ